MQPAWALSAALACAAVAVGIVAVDMAYGLEASLEAYDGDGWRTVASSGPDREPYPYFGGMACAEPEMRLVVDNDRLLSSTVRVVASASSARGENVPLFDETWQLDRGEVRVHEFTLPESLFTPPQDSTDPKPSASVHVQVEGIFLYACAEAA